MNFIANMGISPRTVEFVRSLGHTAVHLHELGQDRLPDSAILSRAREQGAILLTSDLDFGDLLAASHAPLPSVVIFRLQPPMSAEKVNRYLLQVILDYSAELEAGALLSVNEARIRLRRLPISPAG